MVDFVFERHLSGGILLPAKKTASPLRSRIVTAPLDHDEN